MPWKGGPGGRTQLFLLLGASALVGALVMYIVLSLTLGRDGTTYAYTEQGRVDAVDKVGPAVVSIISSGKDGEGADSLSRLGMGSGVIFQKDGGKVRIATNNHVVEEGTSFEVVLSNGERRKATVVGKDRLTDLAVLEMDGKNIETVADFGDSDKLKPGQTAIAIGNPLGLGLSQTVTAGIISWPKRSIPVLPGQDGEYEWELDMIQTDAAINQGNSGGALIDLNGKVIGINSLKVADTGVEGLGFAIPINEAKPVLDELIKHNKIRRPYIGVSSASLSLFKSGLETLKLPDNVKAGAIVLEVQGPALKAGLKTNDVIVQLDDQPIYTTLGLRKYLYGHKKIGDKLQITYYRAGKKDTVTVSLEELNNDK